jgi:hypothetical protein
MRRCENLTDGARRVLGRWGAAFGGLELADVRRAWGARARRADDKEQIDDERLWEIAEAANGLHVNSPGCRRQPQRDIEVGLDRWVG